MTWHNKYNSMNLFPDLILEVFFFCDFVFFFVVVEKLYQKMVPILKCLKKKLNTEIHHLKVFHTCFASVLDDFPVLPINILTNVSWILSSLSHIDLLDASIYTFFSSSDAAFVVGSKRIFGFTLGKMKLLKRRIILGVYFGK